MSHREDSRDRSKGRKNSRDNHKDVRDRSEREGRRGRNPQIYIAKLSINVRKRDLEDRFLRYGDIKEVQLKNGFGFIEYYDYRDAEYACERMDGRTFEGNRLTVQPSKGKQTRDDRYRRDSRERRDDRYRRDSRDRRDFRDGRDERYRERTRDPERKRGGPQPEDKCFNCNEVGHWKSDCKNPRKLR